MTNPSTEPSINKQDTVSHLKIHILTAILQVSHSMKDGGIGARPERGNKAVKGLEQKSDGGQLRERDGSAWRRLKGDLTALSNCLKRGWGKRGSTSAPR